MLGTAELITLSSFKIPMKKKKKYVTGHAWV
jgi:hypothetical protein